MPDVSPADRAQASPAAGFTPASMQRRTWLLLVAAIVAVQAVLRGWVLSGRTFYWDDFIIASRAQLLSPWSPEFWLHPHDGHVAPLAFLTQALVNELAPWRWWLPATLMLAGQAVATVAIAWAARRIAGRTWTSFVAVAAIAVTPLTLPGATWWSAAANALPMHIALGVWVGLTAAAVLGDDPRARSPKAVAGATALLVVALGFFEKTLAVLPVAAALTAAAAFTRRLEPVSAVRRAKPLWWAGGAVTGIWAVVWLSLVSSGTPPDDGGGPRMELWSRGVSAVLSGIVGGPWRWDRWAPSQAWADPPVVLTIAGGVFLAVVGAAGLARNRRAWAPMLVGASYITLLIAAMTVLRSSANTSATLASTLHYYGDAAVVLGLAAAVMFSAPARREVRLPAAPVATALVLALVASSAWSTWTFRRTWAGDPTATWLPTVLRELPAAKAEDPAPLLDQPVPLEVLLPVTNPANLYSSLFGIVGDRPPFGDVTTVPRMFNAHGEIVDAEVSVLSRLDQGPVGQCGHEIRANADGQAMVDLDLSDLIFLGNQVLEFNANASAPMTVRLTLPNELSTPDQILAGGATVEVPAGVSRRWVAIDGGGVLLRVQIEQAPPGAVLCLGAGAMGPLVPSEG